MQTLGMMLETTARWFPDKPFLLFEGESITYAEFNRRTARLAGLLSSLGVGKGTPVGLYLPSTPEVAVAYHACQKIGAIALPISDSYKSSEVETLGRKTRMPVLICRSEGVPVVDAVRGSLPDLQYVLVSGGDAPDWGTALRDELPKWPDVFEPVPVDPEDVAAIFFTSGTTGLPKGAMQTHRAIYHAIRDTHSHHRMRWQQERFLCAVPLFNNFGATFMLNGCLYAAGTLILNGKWDTAAILSLMTEHRATFFAGTPTMFSYLLEGHDPARHDTSGLRLCMAGGAPLPPDVQARFETTFGVPLVNAYGASELCGICTTEAPEGRRKPGSVGRPMGSATISILDDAGNPQPAGQPGEICVAGDLLGAGYWQDAAATAAAFTSHGWRSGDIGMLDEDGFLYMLDRKKDVIITGGSNIFPAEVEAVLAAHPAVALVSVVAVPDAVKGELAIGCIVIREGAEISGETLLSFCRDRLASYKVPRRIEFFDSFPLGPTGKILKREIVESLASRQGEARKDSARAS
ncbi:AMP-binding protein [Paracoccus sp. MC1854]|uniref:class I adenylate-forming enzyme family protein n=1 Tax=Paracoccus sp. MC1854 TaxID=2760306 RepID=UPI0015FF9DE9|nr:AMP-binding protein [Paracoccus sp. MC1854]MBB1492760.1 AMP-binding protein [Paracoccus sp. MC1854]